MRVQRSSALGILLKPMGASTFSMSYQSRSLTWLSARAPIFSEAPHHFVSWSAARLSGVPGAGARALPSRNGSSLNAMRQSGPGSAGLAGSGAQVPVRRKTSSMIGPVGTGWLPSGSITVTR